VTGPLRRAGRAPTADGSEIVWTVADGARGRRWRSRLVRDDELREALLLELDVDGRLARLELTTVAGLLTLHPDHGGERLHGNAAGPAGMRHIDLAWGPEHVLLVTGSPIVAAAAARSASAGGVGEGGGTLPAVIVGSDLAPRAVEVRFERRGETGWSIAVDGRDESIEVDARGVPGFGNDANEWALERDPETDR
jgi:hypothetical protein